MKLVDSLPGNVLQKRVRTSENDQKNISYFVRIPSFLLNPIQDGGHYHIETSPMICGANQWTGFYMITASVLKGLRIIASEIIILTFLYLKQSLMATSEKRVYTSRKYLTEPGISVLKWSENIKFLWLLSCVFVLESILKSCKPWRFFCQ